MADYSYVTVTIENTPDTTAALAAVGDLDQIAPEHWPTETDIELTWPEARYGFPETADTGDPEIWAVVEALTAAGIAWHATDAGGYEWPEAEYAWTPDLDETARRTLDGGGTPALDAHTYRAARERIIPETAPYGEVMSGQHVAALVAWIDGYYGDDPRGWTLPEEGTQ